MYPILNETVDEFKVELRCMSWPTIIAAQHVQLTRTEPSNRCAIQEAKIYAMN